ncbi:serine hydrolase domain-containing protein [Pseudoalteromonas luteoviolacea]|nr:serine hydrolase domain-containing protein [Pseudoalteromonas luteoviolacea]
MSQLRYKTLIAFIMFGLSACGSNTNQSTQPQPQQETKPSQQQGVKQLDYQTLINGLISNEVHGIILHVSAPSGTFTSSAGLANLTTQEVLQPSAVYHLASGGKVFTALLAVQLHEEGLLDLDLTIDNWLSNELASQIQYSDQITLRQLLNHSSGIYNYSDPLREDAYVEFVMANYKSGISNEDLLQFAYGQSGYFKPGKGVKYSNSNYVLIGMIMDSVLGHPNALAMRDKIIDRLALSDTFSVGIEIKVHSLRPAMKNKRVDL